MVLKYRVLASSTVILVLTSAYCVLYVERYSESLVMRYADMPIPLTPYAMGARHCTFPARSLPWPPTPSSLEAKALNHASCPRLNQHRVHFSLIA